MPRFIYFLCGFHQLLQKTTNLKPVSQPMNRLLLILAILTLIQNAYSQKHIIDSLHIELRNPSIADSIKIDVYNELSFLHARVDPLQGLAFADTALALAKETDMIAKEAASLNNRGINFWYMGKDSLALVQYNQVLQIHKQTNNLKGQGTSYNNMALISYNQGDYRSALEFHEMASGIFEQLELTQYLINSLSNTGVVFLAISDYPRALEYFLKSVATAEKSHISLNGDIYTNLGLVYKNLNDLNLSEKYHQQAITFYKENGNLQMEALALSNLANVYQIRKKNDVARELYLQAIRINQKIGNERRLASDFSNYGIFLKGTGEVDSATFFLTQAKNLYSRSEDKLNLSLVLLELADLAKSGYSFNQNGWTEALRLQEQALGLAIQSESLVRQKDAWLALSESYERLNNPAKALSSYKNYTLFKDSIFNEENDREILRLQIEHDFGIKEAQMEARHELDKSMLLAQAAKEKLVKNIVLYSTVPLLFIGITFLILARKRNQAQNARREAEYKAQIAELELKALRAQMNPHFIFNSLNSISNFLLKNQPEEADYYLTRFSRLIRMILESSDQKEIQIAHEIELIDHYIKIEELRLDKKLNFNVNISENLDADNTMIPPLLLQPIIENSIWHGIAKSKEDGVISVDIGKLKNCIHIIVRDNGVGRKDHNRVNGSAITSKKSMGMKIIQERLEVLNRSKSGNAEIYWRNLSPGLEVEIILPFQRY
jgi:tetratricopeptide (TPR) repeat protein